MLTEPVDLDPVVLVETLNQRWELQVLSLEYLPRGFGSHHWLAADSSSGRWFVTVDDLRTGRIGARPPDEAFGTLDMAFRTAVMLRDEARLEFVVAPLADSSGSVLRRLGSHYAVSLFPFVRGDSAADGKFTSDHDRRRVLQLLGRLHRATAALPPGLTRREDFAIPNRDKLIDALAELEAPWSTGPYAEPARQLLRDSAKDVRAALDRYDSLAAEVRASSSSWVVTHGEPHAANVVRDRQGQFLLVDWDTVALGPRERDLWMVLSDGAAEVGEYSPTSGSDDFSPQAIVLYRMCWDLAEIAEYVSWFRRAHEESTDTKAAWADLSKYLPVNPEFLD